MAIELVTKYSPLVDEVFSRESIVGEVTNNDYSFDGANKVKIYHVKPATMNDYGEKGKRTKYGDIEDLEATTSDHTLTRDRGFIFQIDARDKDETGKVLAAASALGRQLREVAIPEVEENVFKCMCAGAGTVANAAAITAKNVYELITAGSAVLDDAKVPSTERTLIVTPSVYRLMKLNSEIAAGLRGVSDELMKKGFVAQLDGALIKRVPASQLPSDFGFMLSHKSACCAPVKINHCKVHSDTIELDGDVITGRLVYDAFVLPAKKAGIYYQPITKG